jgi:SAM-dependent methyltransferase
MVAGGTKQQAVQAPSPTGQTAEVAVGEAVGGLSRGDLIAALTGVFLTSLAFLAFQIAASRVLSLLLSYHFVFALVSLAMLGLGIGGVIARLAFPATTGTHGSLRILAGASAAAAVAVPLGLALILTVAGRPWIGEPTGMLAVLGILFVPLVLAGTAFAQLFRTFGAISGRVYGADLAGAALGCLGIIWALDRLGGIGALLLVSVLAAAGAVAFAWPLRASGGRMRGAMATITAGLALLLFAFLSGAYAPYVPVDANPEKEIHDAMAGPGQGVLEASRWSSFGRTDLVGFGERRDYKDLYTDGTAGSPMHRFTGDFSAPGEAVETLIAEFPGYFPFLFGRDSARESALVIGPGGGRDILLARMGGFEHVRAVEVNPDIVALVRAEAVYNGDIFGARADVEVLVEEGRSFVRRGGERFDLVMLSLPVTNTSRSREGFALTESFLLTAEAIADYVGALRPGGELVIVAHDEAAILRLLVTSIDALAGRGMSPQQVMARSYVLGSFPFPVFVLRTEPIGAGEARAMLVEAQRRGYSPAASYFPGIPAPGSVSPVLQALEQGHVTTDELVRLAGERGMNISGVRDDSPFFHHFDMALPPAVVTVATAAAGITLAILALSLVTGRRSGTGLTVSFLACPLLFVLLGAGFMLIEVSLIQRFMLFLGRPVLVLAVILFVLLIGMSAGSMLSGRVPPSRTGPAIVGAGTAAALLIALLSLFLPPVFDAALGLPLAARVALTAALLTPLGIILGLPFPLAIRALALGGNSERIPWMWALNGTASVLGASAAVLGAMLYGLSLVLLAAVICYGLVAAIGFGLRPETPL